MAGRITLLGLAVSACLPANDGDRPSTVYLQDRTELIAFGPVSQAKVAPLVPHAYTITWPGTAGLVFRASRCQVTVDGSPSRPASVAQIGVAIHVAVSPPGLPAWFETGIWSDPPPNSAAPVVANGYFNGPFGVVKLSTSIGSISYGPAAIIVHTSQLSLLGTLFGGNVGNNFPFFNARGLFGEGQLDIVLN